MGGAAGRRPGRTLLLFAAVVSLVRLLLATAVGLAPDEAYYWQWSESLALSYPDHPPLTAWLIRLGTLLVGDSALGVRFFAVLAGVGALYLVYHIGLAVGLGAAGAAAAAILSNLFVAPAAAALIMTPDTPLGIAWLAAELALIRIAQGGGGRWWYLLGAALAVGILSKYSALLLLLMAPVALLGGARRQLASPHPWLALLLAAAVAAAHVASAGLGEGSALRFQLAHLSGGLPGGDLMGIPERLGALALGQLGLLTPVAAIWVARGVWTCRDRPFRVLTLGLLLPVGATALAAFAAHPEQNWASLGHPGAAVLAVAALRGSGGATAARRRRWTAVVFGTAAVIAAIVHLHVAVPVLPLPPERDPTARLHGWAVVQRLRPLTAEADWILCDNYGAAAQISWQLRGLSEIPPVVGADRQAFDVDGRGLLVDQLGDFGQAPLPLVCAEARLLEDLRLEMGEGRAWDTLRVLRVSGCRRKQVDGVVSPSKQ